jgi:hypothetical protein
MKWPLLSVSLILVFSVHAIAQVPMTGRLVASKPTVKDVLIWKSPSAFETGARLAYAAGKSGSVEGFALVMPYIACPALAGSPVAILNQNQNKTLYEVAVVGGRDVGCQGWVYMDDLAIGR